MSRWDTTIELVATLLATLHKAAGLMGIGPERQRHKHTQDDSTSQQADKKDV